MKNEPATHHEGHQHLGKARKLIEGREKVTGGARYAADVVLPGMLHLRPVLSPHAHAVIESIDKSEAEAVPGVVAVLTAEDLPTRDRMISSRNSAILAKEKVLFVGQPVVAVVAETEAAAQDAADRVRVRYRPLPAAVLLEEAAREDATVVWPGGLPLDEVDLAAMHAAVDKDVEEIENAPTNIHAENHYVRGDVAQGFEEADVVIERTYRASTVYQAYLEPLSAVADPGPTGDRLTIYTSTQGQFSVRDEVARLLSLPRSKVRVVPMTVGGGFGAKYGIVEPLVGAVALTLKRPVQLVLSRSEDFQTTTPSPACTIELKTGAQRDGTLTAIQARVYLDNGIFSFELGGLVAILLGSYYRFPHLQIDCFEVVTNKAQSGAYRAPGAPQATFAIESNMDDMARALDLDPLEFRLNNASETGDLMSNGKPWPSLGLKACLERLRDHPAWREQAKGEDEGIGIAVGGWPGANSPASSVCRLERDGTVKVQVGSIDVSGAHSSLALVAAEVLGVSPDQVEFVQGDTDTGPFSPPSGGSQITYSLAGAVAKAAQEVKDKLLALASDHLEARREDLELIEGKVQVKGVPARAVSIGELARVGETEAGGHGPIIGDGRASAEKNAPAFVVHLVRLRVDRDTGQVMPKAYVAVQDVGYALNPLMVEGQIHGGVAQGIGWGLHEAMLFDESGQLQTGSFMDYDVPKADTLPSIETVLVQNPSPYGPFGARGVGEPPITAGAAAIANAIYDATGVRVDRLPVRPETLWRALQEGDQSLR
ncbi:MAG: xanthine dehydrogenase family protein [Trueperaceae bacterium]|nr:MAG: xanthine dehydrogenase family protein [Trueperaceae bacterium]